MKHTKLPKIIAVVGTNASGKSSIGLKLAQKYNGEIISADSRQVYKGFDLCSGKVTAAEKQLVRHHMLDICDIGEPFSVADFQAKAYALIPEIMERGKLPFIVGGTGLYVASVTRGYVLRDETPDIDFRTEMEKFTVSELRLKLTDEAAAILRENPSDYQNKRRIIRMLEKVKNGEPIVSENAPRYNVLQLGVTWPKDVLHERIDARLTARLDAGMLDEVKSYLDAGGNPAFLYDLGLEYRFILQYLTGEYGTIDEFYMELSRAIKRFAKRQVTWFKRDKTIRWLDMAGDYMGQAEGLVEQFINR